MSLAQERPDPFPVISRGQEVWPALRREALDTGGREPELAALLGRMVLDHSSFGAALAEIVLDSLESLARGLVNLREAIPAVLVQSPEIAAEAAIDLHESFERNPAFPSLLAAFLHAKGFHALVTHRVCHRLWHQGRPELALYVHGLACRAYSVDIHPAAGIGVGVFIDHATGLVVGETASIGDDVSILHGVTLGGTGRDVGDRHPKVGSGVLLGAHAVVLGNISIGDGAKVGAGAWCSSRSRAARPWRVYRRESSGPRVTIRIRASR